MSMSTDTLAQEIQAIRFVRFPTKRQGKVKAVVRCGRYILADLGHGRIAIDRDRPDRLNYTWNKMDWTPPLLDALHRLGVVGKPAMQAHLAQVAANRARRDRRDAAAELRNAAKRMDLPLSKRQQAAIDKALAK